MPFVQQTIVCVCAGMGGGGQFWDGQFFLTVLLVCATQNGWGRGGCKCLCVSVWERERESIIMCEWTWARVFAHSHPSFGQVALLPLYWNGMFGLWHSFFCVYVCIFFLCNFFIYWFHGRLFSLCAGGIFKVFAEFFSSSNFMVKSHRVLFCDVKRKHGHCKEHEVSVISPKTVTLLFVSDCLSGIFKSFAW